MDWTEAAGELVQLAMQPLDAQIVGEPLRRSQSEMPVKALSSRVKSTPRWRSLVASQLSPLK
jgi:hypothetical protein